MTLDRIFDGLKLMQTLLVRLRDWLDEPLSRVLIGFGVMALAVFAYDAAVTRDLDAFGRRLLLIGGFAAFSLGVIIEVLTNIYLVIPEFAGWQRRIAAPAGMAVLLLALGFAVFRLPRTPTLSAAQPTRFERGSSDVALTLVGQHFGAPPIVEFDGDGVEVSDLVRRSSKQLTMHLSIAPDALPGPRKVTVRNPSGKAGSCDVRCFRISLPPPKIVKVEPGAVDLGTTGRVLTVSGRNFDEDATVEITGPGIKVESVSRNSDTEVRATVSVVSDAPVGSRDVVVRNKREGRSDACQGACLRVQPPAPVARSLEPRNVKQGATREAVTVLGANFDSETKLAVSGEGVSIDTGFNSSTELKVLITVSSSAIYGTRDLITTSADGRSTICQGCFTIDRVVPEVKITSPINTMGCKNPDGFCQFQVEGSITGVASLLDSRVYVFVYPVQPAGAGWYPQVAPGTISADGSWVQSPAFIGNTTNPARSGDLLRLRAAVVRPDATHHGRKLSDFIAGDALSSVEDIDGLVALSEPIFLTLQR